ncbi:MAG: prolipoprotein diacylglyceryl transferase [Armatimonadetes bacterium]|nr:prolipoprotein diacylglyceryl transferase [Armatimonadota bacterium]
MRSTLFTVFGIPIRSYGLMLAIGFVLGVSRAARVAKTRSIPPERIFDLGFVTLLSGIFGARLVYILLNMRTEKLAEFFAVWNGGLSFHGGVAFALLFGWLYVRRVGIPFWTTADIAAPSAALGYAITRIGCFLNGCCYGAPTTLPWAVRFNDQGTITPPSHPTQLYATLANLVIFYALTRIEKTERVPGFVFACYLGLYSFYRFLIEFLRKGFTGTPWVLGLTQAQWVSLVIGAACVAAILLLHRKRQDRSVLQK